MTPKHAKPDPRDESSSPQGPGSGGAQSGGTGATPPGAGPATGPEQREVRPRRAAPEEVPAAPSADGAPQPDPASVPPAGPEEEPTRPASAASGRRGGRRKPPVVRSRIMWGLLAVLGIALGAWVVVQLVDSGGEGTAQPSSSPTAVEQQQTLLIQVRNDSDFASDNMVAGIGGGQPTAQVLVQSQLIVDVPGAGQQTIGQSARLLDRTASQDALSDLLALRVDGTLSLGRLALAGMVDFVGGITVDVDAPVSTTDPQTGAETIVVPAGQQLLDGTQAAAYALAWEAGEPEAARLARFSTVMTETIAALPDDELRVDEMLTSLGGSTRTTTSTAEVARFLVEMREGILAGGQQVRVLPTTEIEAGTGLEVVRVNLDAADAMLTTLLPDAQLGDESSPRVLVQNGVGTPGLGAEARDRLVGAGMVYINGGNAEEFGRLETLVIVADESTESLQLGEEVARALGVPSTSIAIAEEGQNVADVVVVLGADFGS